LKFLTEKITSVKNNIIEDFTSNKKLTAEQRDRKRTRMIGRMTAGMMAVMMLTSMFGITAFADAGGGGTGGGDGVSTFNTVIEFIVDWVARIGLVVGFIGAVQFALGFKDDSADGKTRGLMCLASGFIVYAVAKAYSMFTM
jgi:hypothetical protein